MHNVGKCRSSHWRSSIKKVFLEIYNIYRKIACWSLSLIKLQTLLNNFVKKRLQHRCFPMNIVKFLRWPIFKNIYERLLLKMFTPNTRFLKYVWSFLNFIHERLSSRRPADDHPRIQNPVKYIRWSFFGKIVRLSAVNYFRKKLHLECLIQSFLISNTKLFNLWFSDSFRERDQYYEVIERKQ